MTTADSTDATTLAQLPIHTHLITWGVSQVGR